MVKIALADVDVDTNALRERLALRPAIVELIADDPAIVAHAVRRVHEVVAAPISIRTSSAGVLRAGLDAGACIGHNLDGFADRLYLSVLQGHGASVIVCSEPDGADRKASLETLAASAEAAGLDRSMIVLHLPVDIANTSAMRRYTTMCELTPGPAGWGTAAVAVMSGVRIVATAEPLAVRSIRRTADTISELVERRRAAGCDAADAIGFC